MIFESDLPTLGLLWGYFGVNLGSLLAYESDFEILWGYFGITLGSCVGLMGPKSGNVEKVLVLNRVLGAQRQGGCERGIPRGGFGNPRGGINGGVKPSSEGRRDSKGRVLGAFGSDLGSIFVSGCDFGIIMDLLWVYEGPFSKNIHLPY